MLERFQYRKTFDILEIDRRGFSFGKRRPTERISKRSLDSTLSMDRCPKADAVRRGTSSDGRALALHARGTGIDTPVLQKWWIVL